MRLPAKSQIWTTPFDESADRVETSRSRPAPAAIVKYALSPRTTEADGNVFDARPGSKTMADVVRSATRNSKEALPRVDPTRRV